MKVDESREASLNEAKPNKTEPEAVENTQRHGLGAGLILLLLLAAAAIGWFVYKGISQPRSSFFLAIPSL
jgi:uncharacterized protein HemX